VEQIRIAQHVPHHTLQSVEVLAGHCPHRILSSSPIATVAGVVISVFGAVVCVVAGQVAPAAASTAAVVVIYGCVVVVRLGGEFDVGWKFVRHFGLWIIYDSVDAKTILIFFLLNRKIIEFRDNMYYLVYFETFSLLVVTILSSFGAGANPAQ
jgi:hypothetical protein